MIAISKALQTIHLEVREAFEDSEYEGLVDLGINPSGQNANTVLVALVKNTEKESELAERWSCDRLQLCLVHFLDLPV